MSPEDQDAVIGRVVRERREARAHLAALQSEAGRIGVMLEQLGGLLRNSPHSVVFENQGVELKYQRRDAPLFKRGQIDGNILVTLTDDIRRAGSELDVLERRAKELGIE